MHDKGTDIGHIKLCPCIYKEEILTRIYIVWSCIIVSQEQNFGAFNSSEQIYL